MAKRLSTATTLLFVVYFVNEIDENKNLKHSGDKMSYCDQEENETLYKLVPIEIPGKFSPF